MSRRLFAGARRRSAIGVSVALAALAFPATASHATTDTTPPKLVAVELSPTSINVSGFAYRILQVRVHLTDDSGVAQVVTLNGTLGNNSPVAELTRTTAGRGQVRAFPADAAGLDAPALALASGTPKDGWWAGTFRITAGDDGVFTVNGVGAYDTSFNTLDVDPRTLGINASVTVHGTNIPHVSVGQSPNPVVYPNPVTLVGHVTYADTGAPVPNVTVHFGFDIACVDDNLGNQTATSDASGVWRLPIGNGYPVQQRCLNVYNGSGRTDTTDGIDRLALYVRLAPYPHYLFPISAHLTTRMISLGSSTTVVGSTAATHQSVTLQRLVGGSWRTVGTATVRSSGRFTLVAQPPSRGNHRYRVMLPPPSYALGQLTSYTPVMLLGVT